MRVGIHLPQYGRTASPEALVAAAQRAEDLGFADVWVSDHIVQPADQGYPSPYLFDPLTTLAWAGAVTEQVGLGTSVLVLPQRHPLELANSLASLDRLSRGRLTVVGGVGWSAGEFQALGQSFATRGDRTDEIVEILRSCWEQDPVSFGGHFYEFADLRVLPKPAHRIPLWFGGGSEAAYRRAVSKGDGFQLIGVTPAEAQPVIERLRRDRPGDDFTISLRTGWDPQGMEAERIRSESQEYARSGVQHVVAAPWRTDLSAWLESMEELAELVIEA